MKTEFPQLKRGLIIDPIHPKDFREMAFTYACEQCSHFDEVSGSCTIGYDARHHRQKTQLELYERTGRMAFCRFLEID